MDTPTADDEDSLARFAGDLRDLHQRRGAPKWDAVERAAQKAGHEVRRSSLNAAVNGRRLPSVRVLEALLAALKVTEDERREWLDRRRALEPKTTPEAVEPETGPRSRSSPRLNRRSIAALLVLSHLLVGAATWLITRAADAREPAVVTGDDPAGTRCLADAEVIAIDQSDDLQLELIHSAECDAFWARATRLDDSAYGNSLEVSVFVFGDPTGPLTQRAIDGNAAQSYSMLIVRPSQADMICASTAATRGDERAAIERLCP